MVGPTASGKTELAIQLAEALGGEVISADSVQVYRQFDIGSGKPTCAELARAPHHLIDVVEPGEPMDAAQWATLADGLIEAIRQRNRRPIVCGGTFLWVKALLFGLADAPPADPAVRQRHLARAEAHGRATLHNELGRIDPLSAERLAPNDFVRVSRALEVFELTGVPMSEWQARHGFREARYPARLVGLAHPREQLDQRIGARVDAMLAAGWLDEVRALVASGHAESRPMRSVGYRQIREALEAEGPLDPELRDKVYRATRIFARRQRTWLRDQPVRWIDPQALATGRAVDSVLKD